MAGSFDTNGDLGLGRTLDQILIKDRNGKAWQVMSGQFADEKIERIGVLYGAAHMPDFDKRLIDAGFEFKEMTWVTAWNLRRSEASKITVVIEILEPLVEQLMELID